LSTAVPAATDGGLQLTIPVLLPGDVTPTYAAGHVTVGACLSSTVSTNEHCDVRLDVSTAVQTTVLDPNENVEPDAGEQLDDAKPTLSLAAKAHDCTTLLVSIARVTA
jgi:hypothetical protein